MLGGRGAAGLRAVSFRRLGLGRRPSRCACLRASLRARRIASTSRASSSQRASRRSLAFISRNTPSRCIFFLEHAKSLLDIVVAYENLQSLVLTIYARPEDGGALLRACQDGNPENATLAGFQHRTYRLTMCFPALDEEPIPANKKAGQSPLPFVAATFARCRYLRGHHAAIGSNVIRLQRRAPPSI